MGVARCGDGRRDEAFLSMLSRPWLASANLDERRVGAPAMGTKKPAEREQGGRGGWVCECLAQGVVGERDHAKCGLYHAMLLVVVLPVPV